jgi:hypothetical protein
MSSVTNDGKITITPVLNAAEITKFNQALKANVKLAYQSMSFTKTFQAITDPAEVRSALGIGLEVSVTERETDEGTLHVRTAGILSYADSAAEPRITVSTVVGLLRKTFPSHILEGELVSVNEDSTAALKIVAANGTVSSVTGTVVIKWADKSADTEMRTLT